MSVKRLMLVDEFHRVVSKRLKELFKDFDHAKRENFKDIVSHLDYSHTITKELLERAKKYQKRDLEAKKK
jgi:phosphopantothenate synthetase